MFYSENVYMGMLVVWYTESLGISQIHRCVFFFFKRAILFNIPSLSFHFKEKYRFCTKNGPKKPSSAINEYFINKLTTIEDLPPTVNKA